MNRGFTLIELIVTLTIIISFTALGVPSFSRFGSQQVLVQESEKSLAILAEAQSLSLAPLGGHSAYVVDFRVPKTVELKALKLDGIVDDNFQTKTIVLDNKISLSDNTRFSFLVSDQGRLAADRTVTLIHSGLGPSQPKVISGVSASGLIEIR